MDVARQARHGVVDLHLATHVVLRVLGEAVQGHYDLLIRPSELVEAAIGGEGWDTQSSTGPLADGVGAAVYGRSGLVGRSPNSLMA